MTHYLQIRNPIVNTPLNMISTAFSTLCKSSLALTLGLGLSLSVFAEEANVATVNMTKLLNGYHKTNTAQAEEQKQSEAIQKLDEERVKTIQVVVAELQKLQKEFNDPSISQEKRQSLAGVAKERQEYLANLQREREEFLQRNRRALSQTMAGLMNEIRFDVMKAVSAYAATQEDIDYVVDESGMTANQVPFLLYVRDKKDITEAVLKNINVGHETKKAPTE